MSARIRSQATRASSTDPSSSMVEMSPGSLPSVTAAKKAAAFLGVFCCIRG
jgi:hypothetical protein